ncbi:MAG: hypothetical protein ACR2N5_08470 [Solirubrobacterales bacterium]
MSKGLLTGRGIAAVAAAIAAILVLVFVVGGDDEDESDPAAEQAAAQEEQEAEAVASICTAAEDIEQRVGDLASLSILDSSLDEIQEDVSAIADDVGTIVENAPDLRASERGEIAGAVETLESSLGAIQEIGDGGSIAAAASLITGGFSELGSSVGDLLAPLDC